MRRTGEAASLVKVQLALIVPGTRLIGKTVHSFIKDYYLNEAGQVSKYDMTEMDPETYKHIIFWDDGAPAHYIKQVLGYLDQQ